jgi:hypothetical protein
MTHHLRPYLCLLRCAGGTRVAGAVSQLLQGLSVHNDPCLSLRRLITRNPRFKSLASLHLLRDLRRFRNYAAVDEVSSITHLRCSLVVGSDIQSAVL